MRKFSLAAGVLLTLAVSATTMAATPAAATRTVAAPAVPTTTLTWNTTFTKSAISGSAVLSGTSTYTADKVVVHATGVKKGTAVVLRLLWKSGTHIHAFATTTVVATLTKSGEFVRTWNLTTIERAVLKSAEAHKYVVYFRLVDGPITATGLLK